MKKYKLFVNESIFSGWGKKKEPEPKEQPKKVYLRDSDQHMEELIAEIKDTFKIGNLKWNHSSLNGKNWTYNLNGVDINLRYDNAYSRDDWELIINNKSVETSLISDKLLQELTDFFNTCELKEKTYRNSEIFSSAITSRRNAAKYNI